MGRQLLSKPKERARYARLTRLSLAGALVSLAALLSTYGGYLSKSGLGGLVLVPIVSGPWAVIYGHLAIRAVNDGYPKTGAWVGFLFGLIFCVAEIPIVLFVAAWVL